MAKQKEKASEPKASSGVTMRVITSGVTFETDKAHANRIIDLEASIGQKVHEIVDDNELNGDTGSSEGQ